MEIELDHGRVVAKETDRLPDEATGLVTILHPAPKESNEASGWARWKRYRLISA